MKDPYGGWSETARRRRSRSTLGKTLLAFSILCVFLLSFTARAVATVPATSAPVVVPTTAPEDFCASQLAAYRANQALIKQHNAEPHLFTLPRERGAYNAYNREAKELNAKKAALSDKLNACLDAMAKLATGLAGPPNLLKPTQAKLDAIDQAKAQLGPGYRPPPPPRPGEPWRIPTSGPLRALFKAIRADNPPKAQYVPWSMLQGRLKTAIGSMDKAYPPSMGYRVKGVSADHIIPLARLVQDPEFLKLNAQNMYLVSRSPVNFQWLSYRANLAKSSRSAANMMKWDPAFRAQQTALENETWGKLQDIIKQLLKSQ